MLVAVMEPGVSAVLDRFSAPEQLRTSPLGSGSSSAYGADKPVFDEQYVYMSPTYVKRTFGIGGPQFPTMEIGLQIRADMRDYKRWLNEIFRQGISQAEA